MANPKVGPFFQPPAEFKTLNVFPLVSASSRFNKEICQLSGALTLILTPEAILILSNSTPIVQKPFCLLPDDFFEYFHPKWVHIAKRSNVYDDFKLYLNFESETQVLKLEEQLKSLTSSVARRLYTKIYLADHNKTTARLLDTSLSSHRSLFTLISDVLTALAYGNGAPILAPLAFVHWSLETPTAYATKLIQDQFLARLPPIIVMEKIWLLSTATARAFREIPDRPLKPHNISDVSDVAVKNFGYDSGSHDPSKHCIYFNDSLIQLFVDVYNANLPPHNHQSSFFAVVAVLKITLIHELAHFFVAVKSDNRTPPRTYAEGGSKSFFNTCVVEEDRLEAGLVVEKMWLQRHYRLAYKYHDGKESELFLYYKPDPPEPSTTPDHDVFAGANNRTLAVFEPCAENALQSETESSDQA
ncbi:hypothetical protein BT96DRAFT_1018135 [Gymnopus androsaceus JB14]|uniref:Uncharacterized protein n=1 Tax=Gymnopus androsaceus JB14 TaxID=1447944 RepID=A0A6A4HST2_9AGAR|nr:hypothetical protein BT96DRAFT_1018135 [Gymnopus androsaceus JB14]